MSKRYQATCNVQAPLALTTREALDHYFTDVHAAMLGKVDAHMIVEQSGWVSTRVPGLAVLSFTYTAGQDTEAVAIIHDAARVAGASYDAVRVTQAGRVLDGPALLAAAR